MTREKAMSIIRSSALSPFNERMIRLEKAIHAIYSDIDSDIESKTCENCKHYDYGYCSIMEFKSDSGLVKLETDKDFGCNKFENRKM